ncbi:adenosylcobinamide-GDP ribazoletransferase [Sagittula sp.]|uniref:adenosylcobinamide-GDP ribazoletransferase n=1 Tax=Sagittula sp. TaxID=2038081 RepID=UPI004059AEC9
MKDTLRLEAELFRLALGEVTRLVPPAGGDVSEDLLVRSVKYHPVIGALVGCAGAAVLWLAAQVLPEAAAVLVAVVAMLLLSGVRDEMGLSVAVEALAGETGRDAVLTRMARGGGPRGALAVGLTLALKVVLLVSFTPGVAAVALIAGMGLGRMAAVHTAASTVSARRRGMEVLLPGVTPDGYRVALAGTILAVLALEFVAGAWAGVAAGIGAIALGQAFRIFALRRLGGRTTEILGGAALLGELGTYLGLAVVL